MSKKDTASTVTEEMIDAGLAALYEAGFAEDGIRFTHLMARDLALILYQAMATAANPAKTTSESQS